MCTTTFSATVPAFTIRRLAVWQGVTLLRSWAGEWKTESATGYARIRGVLVGACPATSKLNRAPATWKPMCTFAKPKCESHLPAGFP